MELPQAKVTEQSASQKGSAEEIALQGLTAPAKASASFASISGLSPAG